MAVGQYGPEVILSGVVATPTVLALTSITVKNPDNTAATLYTDTTGTTTTSNVVSTDARGNLTFFAAAGPYKLVYTDTIGAQTLTVIVYEDAADISATYDAGPATVIHVDPAGSDANSGLIASKPKLTLAAALAALPGGVGVIQLRPFAVLTHSAGDSFALDVSKVRIVGLGSVLYWTAAPTAGYAVHLFSTVDYTTGYKNWATALDGVIVRGNLAAALAATGIKIGHTVNALNSEIVLANGGVEGFTPDLQFIQNAYRFHAKSFHLRGSGASITAATGLANFGENMQFSDCTIENAITVSSGQWHFRGCALDNAPITADGPATSVFVHGGHMENPAAVAAARYGTVTNQALLQMDETLIFINKPSGGDFTLAPFLSSSVSGGIVLRDCNLPQQTAASWFTPEVTDGDRVLVAGTGRVYASGNSFVNTQFGNGYAIAKTATMCQNGDLETGTTAGWTTLAGTQAPSADAAVKHAGTTSLKLAPAGGGAASGAKQTIPVRPGQNIFGAAWANLSALTGAASITVTWLAADGTTSLGNLWSKDLTVAGGGWAAYAWAGPAPAGAAFAFVQAYTNNGGGTDTVLNVDDLIMSAN